MNSDRFAEQVNAVVVQLNNWLRVVTPDPDRLMPALAVVLGRVMSHRAESEDELHTMLAMATAAMTAAALEDWHARTPPVSH